MELCKMADTSSTAKLNTLLCVVEHKTLGKVVERIWSAGAHM